MSLFLNEKPRQAVELTGFYWRPRPESNRGARICSPLRHHSATWPISTPLIRDCPPPLSICVTQFREWAMLSAPVMLAIGLCVR